MPRPYTSRAELLARAEAAGLSIAELMLANECAGTPRAEGEAGLDAVFDAMEACIDRGVRADGVLPGGLDVPRPARRIRESLRDRAEWQVVDPLAALDWVNLWALAVNE